MEALAREQGWERGIELGLGAGLLFQRFLSAGIEMIGVDLGRRDDRAASVREIIEGQTGIERVTAKVFWMSTREAAKHVEDGWADFVFIDAAHSYEAVKADIADWRPKVRPGGWFGGHDYHPQHPGVVKAVDEAFPNRALLDHSIWSAPC